MFTPRAARPTSRPSASTRGSTASCCAPRASTIATARATRARRFRPALGMAAGRDQRGGDENVVVRRGRRGVHLRRELRGAQQRRRGDQEVHRRAQRQRVVHRQERRAPWPVTSTASPPARPTSICTSRRARFIQMIGGKDALKLAGKVEAGVKNLLAAQRVVRGPGAALLRPHRRPRHGAAHPDLRVPQDPGGAGHPAHPHQEGQGLPARAASSRTSSTAWASTSSKPAKPPRPRCRRTRNSSATRWPISPTATRRSSPSPAPCPAARASGVSRSGTRRSTTTWASPRNTRRCSPAGWRCRG